MRDILVHLRAMQMFAQTAHHLVARAPFHSDHKFFGDAYEAAADDYDGVAERIANTIGIRFVELFAQHPQCLIRYGGGSQGAGAFPPHHTRQRSCVAIVRIFEMCALVVT